MPEPADYFGSLNNMFKNNKGKSILLTTLYWLVIFNIHFSLNISYLIITKIINCMITLNLPTI